MKRALAAAVAALALAVPAAAAACPRTSLGAVEKEVMCPVCGTSLAVATEAPQAQRQRALIVRLVRQCKSKEEVKAALAAEFGDEVLATPGGDGFDLAAWLVPLLGVLAALTAIALAVTRWRRRTPAPAPASTAAASPADAERLERDIRRYDL